MGLKGWGKLEFVFSSGIGFSGDFSGSVFCTGYLIAGSRVCWEVIAALDVEDDWNGEIFCFI